MRKKPNMSVLRALYETLKEKVSAFKYAVIQELGKISIFINILIPVLLTKSGTDTLLEMILLSCLWVFLARYIDTVGKKLNGETDEGVPMPQMQFTQISNGTVILDREHQAEAIIYLHEIEEYFKEKGLTI